MSKKTRKRRTRDDYDDSDVKHKKLKLDLTVNTRNDNDNDIEILWNPDIPPKYRILNRRLEIATKYRIILDYNDEKVYNDKNSNDKKGNYISLTDSDNDSDDTMDFTLFDDKIQTPLKINLDKIQKLANNIKKDINTSDKKIEIIKSIKNTTNYCKLWQYINKILELPKKLVVCEATDLNGNIDCKVSDLCYLRKGEWLNDQCVNAYIALLRARNIKRLNKVLTMTSFFYVKLTQLNDPFTAEITYKYDYNNVKRWTKHSNNYQ